MKLSLKNKVGMQINFLLYSGKDKIDTVNDIVEIAEDHASDKDKEIERLKEMLLDQNIIIVKLVNKRLDDLIEASEKETTNKEQP